MTPEKILIIRLSSLGDILLTTPLIRALRKRFPQAQIDFVVKAQFAEVLYNNPYLNQIHTLDPKSNWPSLKKLKKRLRKENYDVILDLHKNFRSFFLRNLAGKAQIFGYRKYILKRLLLIYLGVNLYTKIKPVYLRYQDAAAPLGIKEEPFGLDFVVTKEVEHRIIERLKNKGWVPDKLTIGVAPGAGFFTKRWPAERFARLADVLIEKLNAQILILGGVDDEHVSNTMENAMRFDAMNFSGSRSIQETGAAMKQCTMIVSNDSGLMHLAQALNKPVVAIFGSTTRELGFFPQGENARIVEKPIGCRPCSHIGRDFCPRGHFRCMKAIPVEEVMEATIKVLKSKKEFGVVN